VTAIIYSDVPGGLRSASALIFAGKCACTGFIVITSGADATLTLYNGADDSGGDETIKAQLTVVNANKYGGRNYSKYPMRFDDGLYAKIAGSGAKFLVEGFARAE
jgi:hypothetical protein